MNFNFSFISKILVGKLALILLTTVQAQSGPGSLDPSFGNGGKVFIFGNTFPRRVRVQPDGKIVTFGDYPYGSYAFLARNDSHGTPDFSFSGGLVYLRQFEEEDYYFSDFVPLPDGKYLITGYKDGNLALFRYNSSGLRDASFGNNGVLTDSFSGEAIALQLDGKVIIGGYNLIDGVGKGFLVRYNTDGKLDTDFGENGIVFADGGADKIVLQPDAKILVRSSQGTIARYNPNGTRDNNFGSNGVVSPGISLGLGFQSNGKIIFGGPVAQNLSRLERYNENGTLDTTFGTNGRVDITDTSNNQYSNGIIRSIAIQRNNKIVTAGSVNGIFAVYRFDPNGGLDATFGTNGLVTTQVSAICRLWDITLQPDGKIVAVGDVSNPYGNVGLVRYLGDIVVQTNRAFDFDGDGQADLATWRDSSGVWSVTNSSNVADAPFQFGLVGDRLVPGDYDGDGRADYAVWRPSTGFWYIQQSSVGYKSFQFGAPTDLPVQGDFDGDGKTDFAVFRPSTGTWHLQQSTAGFAVVQFGTNGDKPVAGDYDGDGKTDIAIFRPSDGNWYQLRSAQGFTVVHFGISTDKVVPADFDGDGKTDLAVYRDSTGTWYLQQSAAGFSAIQFGVTNDIPAAADFDGDGKADISVYRPSNATWYRINSSNSAFSATQFGLTGDRPVPSGAVPVQ